MAYPLRNAIPCFTNILSRYRISGRFYLLRLKALQAKP